MPLIAHREKSNRVAICTEIQEEIDNQIKEYCKWSGVTDVGYFIEESIKYVLAADEQWKKHLQEVEVLEES